MTTPSRRSLVRVLGTLLLVSLTVSAKGTTPTLDGCAEKVTAPEIHMARSPEQLMRAIEWAYDNRSAVALADAITADFVMACATSDSAGNSYRGAAWTREDEIRFFSDLVDPYRIPKVRELNLDLDKNVVVTSDPRPEYAASGQHKLIRTAFTLRFAEGEEPVRTFSGQLQFSIVRADTANLPESRTTGTKDKRVWYLQRWEDVTGSGGTCSFPGRNLLSSR